MPSKVKTLKTLVTVYLHGHDDAKQQLHLFCWKRNQGIAAITFYFLSCHSLFPDFSPIFNKLFTWLPKENKLSMHAHVLLWCLVFSPPFFYTVCLFEHL